MTTTASAPAAERTRRLVNLVAVVAALDFLLLVPLLYGSLTDDHGLISILGPLHGVGFLIDLALAMYGAYLRMWGWWFPAIVVITLGPPGALIGHRKVTGDLSRRPA